LPKSQCIPNITVQHLLLACEAIGLPFAAELDKRHPKDPFAFGRVRVQLRDEQGELRNARVKNGHDLLKRLGEVLPGAAAKVGAMLKDKEREKGGAGGGNMQSVSDSPGITLVPRLKKKSNKKVK